ncbi:MAG: hypothetical protein JXA03_15590, partial [Bacteroidales bacterium]|nr:hypothetical protein [Bacteroidales bacterium]
LFAGSASGGVWKSNDGGVTFKPVFDKHNQSIGAVAIDQNHPDTLWVGTGESWVRNSVSSGDGIYKSTDGGESWKHLGLEATERIARILIHPENPDIVYVAAMGHLWNANAERGVFRTNDGGKSWEKILYVDENTGCCDLAMDPSEPGRLYAAMWQFRRYPFFFESGGSGSGLYVTEDGGKSWEKSEKGFAEGPRGRIAVSVSPVHPDIVYALVESDKSTLYRSTDKGKNWEQGENSLVAGERPFYFSYLVADPVDTNRVYKPGYTLNVSEDGGKHFKTSWFAGGSVHPDLHALWISRKDNNLLYLGTDGGIYISNNRGNTWRFVRNLPVSQFYHVAADNKAPYNVYGGLQDNGSWMGPSDSPGGIQNKDWQNIGGGDGFNAFPDPYDDNLVYWQYQGGNIKRKYAASGEVKDVKPYPEESSEELRFNWNTPFLFSPERDVMYVGAQCLFRSYNKGDTWIRISPDLTTDDSLKQLQHLSGGITVDNTTAENHCTIYTVNESPVDTSVIWAGTDDGNLQITRDGGKTWKNVAGNISGLPERTWCSCITPGCFAAGTAYATFDGHRTGDKTPYIFKTEDYGHSWVSIADENVKGYCYKIIEDIENPELLFLGTELGLFVSIDGGEVWSQFRGNLPDVSIRDLCIHRGSNDLILATHGRGIMIIDDITPLRHLTGDVLGREFAFLPGRPYLLGYRDWEMTFAGDDEFTGPNPEQAVMITYYLRKRHIFGDMFIEIFNASGQKVKILPAGMRKGINRVPWRMRMKPPRVPVSSQLAVQALYGPSYPAGEYTVRVTRGEEVSEDVIRIGYDPKLHHSAADRMLQQETLMKAYSLLEDLAFLDHQAAEILTQSAKAGEIVGNKTLGRKLTALSTEMERFRKELSASTESAGITGEEKLREKIAGIYGSVLGYQGRPTQSQVGMLETLQAEFNVKRAFLDRVAADQLPALNEMLEKEGMNGIVLTSAETFFEKD